MAENKKVDKETAKADKKGENVDKADGYTPKAKPKLEKDVSRALTIRKKEDDRRPAFKRQEWFRYKRLGEAWRRPRGLHSKMRINLKYRPNVVRDGYRGPKKARGLHPSGFEEVMVHNPRQLEGLDPTKQAIRIGGTVGTHKREAITEKADKIGLRILNRRG